MVRDLDHASALPIRIVGIEARRLHGFGRPGFSEDKAFAASIRFPYLSIAIGSICPAIGITYLSKGKSVVAVAVLGAAF
jgi:hypothetical protein